MIELLYHPLIVCLFAFLTGIFTKLADVGVDHGVPMSKFYKVLYGILWGVCGSLVVLGNTYVAAFYFGILLSWIVRYKLDYYNHGIGGAMILFAIVLILPITALHLWIIIGTFVLFTLFGILSREYSFKLGWFQEYNVYSFIYLGIISVVYPVIWIVVAASLANVIGYHGVKKYYQK